MRTALFGVILLLSISAFAQTPDLINADRPGIADSSMAVHRGTFQIEAGLERDDDSGSRALSTPALLRYGLTEAFELRVEGNGYQHVDAGGLTSNGLAPVSIGAKFHFLDEDPSRRQPSLGVIARLFVPSGTGDFRSKAATGDVRLAGDLDLNDHWAVNPNLGIRFDEGDDGRFTAALAALTIQYNFSPTLNVFVDGGAEAPEARGGTAGVQVDTGVAWIAGRDTQLDASVGWRARGETMPRVFWSAGLSRRF